MKKTCTLFAALFAVTSLFAAADIYEIRPFLRNPDPLGANPYVPSVDTMERKNVPYTTADAPLQAGEKLYFNVRLVARTDLVPSGEYAGDFRLVHTGSLSSEALDWVINTPQIGIFVGGTLKYAKMVLRPTPMPYNYTDASYGNTKYLFDTVFEYTVEPGDLGLPIRLALKDGTPAGSRYDSEGSGAPTTEYLTRNLGQFNANDPWRIKYYDEGGAETTELAGFTFAGSRQNPAYKKSTATGCETENPGQTYCLFSNYTLSQCGFFVQTVDFDRDQKRNPGWKTVRANRINQTSVEIIDGEMFATNAISEATLYAWAVDPAWLEAKLNPPQAATWKDPAVTVVGSDAYITTTGTTPSTKVSMAKVTIREKTLYANFSVKGVTPDQKATIILSSSKDFNYNSGTGNTLDKDFITCEVSCIEGKPELTLKLTETKDTYTVTSDYTSTLTTMKLTLTDAYTEDVDVTITPKLTSGKEGGLAVSDVVRLSDVADPRSSWKSTSPLVVTIPKGSTDSLPVYLYGMGASADQNNWDDGLGQKVAFELTYNKGAEFIKEVTADDLYVVPAMPEVANKTALQTMSASSGEPLTIKIRDNFTDVADTTKGYTIKALWWDGSGLPAERDFRGEAAFDLAAVDGTTTFKPDAEGVLTELKNGLMIADELPVIPARKKPNLCLLITAPNTAKTEIINVSVAQSPEVVATAYDAAGEESMRFGELTANEPTVVSVGVEITQGGNKSGRDLYAFLEPVDPNMAEYISGRCVIVNGAAAAKGGIRIRNQFSSSTTRGEITLLDGVAGGTELEFKVVLCTESTYAPDKVYSGYLCNDNLIIVVDNVKPTVNNISMSGWNLNEDKTAFEDGATATKGIDQYFTFDIADAGLDLAATGDDKFALTYQFKGCSPKYSKSQTYYGNPADLIVTNRFDATGTATLSVTLLDKDGGKTGPISYTFEVSNNPRITIENQDGITSFFEDESPTFWVNLSANSADEPLTVELTVSPKATGEKRGDLQLDGDFQPKPGSPDVYVCTYPARATARSFGIKSADGASGGSRFEITAKVTTESFMPDTETPWSAFFEAGILSPIEVKNAKPSMTVDGRACHAARDLAGESDDVIYLNSSNTPIQVAVGDAEAITWSVNDVPADLTKGVTMTIRDAYGSHPITVYDTSDQSYTPQFKNPGSVTVELTASDKDGGSLTAVRFYTVKAERMLTVAAVGPSENGNGSPHDSYYRGAGRGQGHVYVNTPCTGANAWIFDYNGGLAQNVKATAQGYRKGDVDDGSLTKNGSLGDIAILPDGSLAPAGTRREQCFSYEDDHDSFFYVWLKDATADDGTFTSIIYGDVSPEVKQAGSATFLLPTQADDGGAYPLSMYEAIFSREFLTTDNIGDINADGIPDIYALGYKGFGVSGKDQTDMTDLSSYNGDGDYFPFIFDDVQSSFVFMPSNSWVSNSRKFTARREIRGWGDHFNNAWQVLNAQGYAGSIPEYTAEKVYTNPVVDKNSTLTPLEYDAWLQSGRDPNWSPERPTDPTKADTDGDGMPDGYEYYIWYKAHVGWIDGNGIHQYATGRRYNPVDPYSPIEITSAKIAEMFDPLTNSGSDWDTRDTDDDGLSDYAESILGTNPFDYDTDGDGLPDGYEVVFTGTDPLKADTNQNGTPDGSENSDGDSMAILRNNMVFVTVLGANGPESYCYDGAATDCTLVYDTTASHGVIFNVLGGGNTTNRFLTTRNWIASTYTNDADKVCLRAGFNAKNTWTCEDCEVEEASHSTNLVRIAGISSTQCRCGTVVDTVDDSVEYFNRKVSCVGAGTWYLAYQHPHGYARGQRVGAASVLGKPVLAFNASQAVDSLHYQVYQQADFNPNTGWTHPGDGSIGNNSITYTDMDELMSMTFFHRMGHLTEADMTVTPQHSRIWIWQHYSTHPKSVDTDGDRMPDGWEFYMMSGKNGAGGGGPNDIYSPLYDFNKIPSTAKNARDNDTDALEWPAEYSGTSSSGKYGWTPVQPTWRNKSGPTDPWNKDTDGDGIRDGSEGGNMVNSSDWQGSFASAFLYNTSGRAGGGLNPLSWDTDMDGLPDPWELEFHGSYNATESATVNVVIVGSTNTTSLIVGNRCTWNMDGMDGTVSDARLDYDGDGLANWQEYMVGTMRCWRYDDCMNTWGVQTAANENLPDPDTDEWNQYWYDRLLDVHNNNGNYNPNLANGYFDPGMYMTMCRNPWDAANGRYYYFHDGVDHNLSKVMSMDNPTYYKIFYSPEAWIGCTFMVGEGPDHYISCDPRAVDSDGDGMDDYYELFHGLNPLLGKPGVVKNTLAGPFNACDLVYDAYARKANKTTGGGSYPSALNNWWCNDELPHREAHIKNPELGGYDFIAYPWLNGIITADPDGDNIVNQEEAILPNVQAAATYHHTDPTPLWMTDTSYTNSLTRKYYRNSTPDGYENTAYMAFFEFYGERTFKDPTTGKEYKLDDFAGFTYDDDTGVVTFNYDNTPFGSTGWMWSFEENEGYDSDHDYLSDYEEGQGKTKRASDPQVHDSPLRRQAMYFGGDRNPSFLQTPVAEEEATVGTRASVENRQNFLYYTVECWAKADAESLAEDGKLRTLVERAIYADNASAADEQLLRKNFLVGIKNGRWYTCFDSSGTDIQPVEAIGETLATTNWTHLAATYDGQALRLYVNGACVSTHDTAIQPEHGVAALSVSKAGALASRTSFFPAECISILVGASAHDLKGLIYDSAWRFRSYRYVSATNPDGLNPEGTSFNNYTNFYKGYIDEVRIWDGARTANDIKADYDDRTRYTFELAATNRQDVFENWCLGARRSPDAALQLPPQLMYHWAFDHITGAVLTNDIVQVPAGFNTDRDVLNARARWSRPDDYVERNWQSTAVRSTVYTDCAWVPWINNTVSHLPRFDETTLDSVYWSADYAGYSKAGAFGYERFGFPRNAEVYSRRKQQVYSADEYYDSHRDPFFDYYNGITLSYVYLPASVQDRDTRWHAIAGYDASFAVDEAVLKYRFASRDRLVCGDDLLPMGGVYPRRISEDEGGMWDDNTASDAWAQTGDDRDNNGLPDWWEAHARANYNPSLAPGEAFKWDTPVTYNGVKIPAYEAYLRDLAKGLVKIGDADPSYRDAYADKRDVDGDSIPDWWEDIYGVDTVSPTDAKADPDQDGLSSLIEYLIWSTPDFPALRANRMATDSAKGQLVPDYFRRHGSLYLGEMFADHDMIEDWWEDQQPVELARGSERLANYSRFVYDANRDSDNDGWNNWQECRAAIYLGSRQELDYVKTNVTVTTIIGTAEDVDAAYAAAVNEYGEANVTLNRSSATNEYASASLIIREGIEVFKTVANYTGRPVPEVPIAVAYNGNGSIKSLAGRPIVVKAWCQESAFDPDMNGEADATWVFVADDSFPLNMTTNLVAATNGYLRSGRNMFVAYVGTGSTGGKEDAAASAIPAYVPGQPYGVVADVRVDYLKSAPLSIEMTDVHAAIARIDLPAAFAAQAAGVGDMSSFVTSADDLTKVLGAVAEYFDNPTNALSGVAEQYVTAVNNGYEAVRATIDRGVNERKFADLACPMTVGTNATFTSSNVLVRIYRSRVNGISKIKYKDRFGKAQLYKMSADEPAFERTINIATHPYLTEADLYAEGLLDLDWGMVTSVYDDSGLSGLYGEDVVSADYRVVIGDGTGSSWTNNNILAALIVNHYEQGFSPTAASNLTVTAYGSQPTFFWTHVNTIGKAYPAFQLVVKDGETVIYDSGAMPAPPRNGKGEYVFTAPIWPGMMTASGAVVEADRDYTWQVSMLDAKFSEMPDDAACGKLNIRNQSIVNDYGLIGVSVKYMGPGTVATSGVENLIRVEAYLSPDFSGMPYGVGYVSDTGTLAAETLITSNACVTGLLKDRDYYLKAFLDTNGNGVRDEWESWGYMNYVGTGSNELYTARAVSLTQDSRKLPPCVIYIEDADTNNNQLPDVWEWNKDGCLGGPSTTGLSAKSPYVVTISAEGAAAQSILWTVARSNVTPPYYTLLAQAMSGNAMLSPALALAVAGIDPTLVETDPELTITAFSLADGITLSVDPGVTVAGKTIEQQTMTSILVKLTLQLQETERLGGDWQDVGEPVSRVFSVSGTTTISIPEINAAIQEAAENSDGSAYFRVRITGRISK